MTFKEFKELRSLDDKGLEKEYQTALHFLRNSAFENAQGNLKDTSILEKGRKYIAQIRTIQSEHRHEDKQKAQEAKTQAPQAA